MISGDYTQAGEGDRTSADCKSVEIHPPVNSTDLRLLAWPNWPEV